MASPYGNACFTMRTFPFHALSFVPYSKHLFQTVKASLCEFMTLSFHSSPPSYPYHRRPVPSSWARILREQRRPVSLRLSCHFRRRIRSCIDSRDGGSQRVAVHNGLCCHRARRGERPAVSCSWEHSGLL